MYPYVHVCMYVYVNKNYEKRHSQEKLNPNISLVEYILPLPRKMSPI